MKELFCFVSNSDKVNNAVKQVAKIGELSPLSKTFSSDVGFYQSNVTPSIAINVFKSVDNDNNSHVTPAQSLIDKVLERAAWLSSAGVNGAVLATLDEATWKASFGNAFPTSILELTVHDVVFDDTNHHIPEIVSWIEGDTKVTLYFTDRAFDASYSNYEIVSIDPVSVLNDLQRPYHEISGLIKKDLNLLLNEANSISTQSPYTKVRVVDVKWIDKATTTEHTIQWVVAIYGKYGDNPININKALREHILANSDFTDVEWASVMPDLFRPKEFVIIPQWNRAAITDHNGQAIYYSPAIRNRDIIKILEPVKQMMEPAHVDQYAVIVPSTYRNIPLTFVGNKSNDDGVYDILDIFPDYIEVSLNSPNHNDTSEKTQKWMVLLEDMLRVAESTDIYEDLPDKYSKIRRGTIDYMISEYEGVNYLVAMNYSYTAFIDNKPA